MFKLALKSVLARKGRLLLTSLAVIAGTAFLAGVFVLHRHRSKSFDDLFADVFAKTDAYVRSRATSSRVTSAPRQRERIPDSIVAEVAAVPACKQANADIMGFARIIGPTARTWDRTNGPPSSVA